MMKNETWIVKIDDEWYPNDFDRWTFNSLKSAIKFLKQYLLENHLIDDYDETKFFNDLEEEASTSGCVMRTVRNGGLDMFVCMEN